MNRYCIYPKEISILLGKSNSYSCNLVRLIRETKEIKTKRPITIKEFCDYMDLSYDDIFALVNNYKSA